MPPRRKRPGFPRALGSALCLLLAVLLALGPVRPVWAAVGAGLAAPVHQFAGVEPDPGTGLYHFGVRAYDPTLRRWLSADPLLAFAPNEGVGSGEVLNLYGYANNNPIIAIDPDGKNPIAVAIAVGFVLAAPFLVKSEKDIPKATASAVVGGVVTGGLSMAGRAALEKIAPAVGGRLSTVLKPASAVAEQKAAAQAAAQAAEKTVAKELSNDALKGIRSLEKQISKHESKLAEFKANPTVRPGMEGQPKEVIEAAQRARIKHLEKEIQTFKQNIEKLKKKGE